MLCIGFGRWPPQNITEAWLTIVSMMVGATFYALFIGNMSTLLLSIDSSGRLYSERVRLNIVPYSTYYKPMMYYKPTPLFSSKFLYRYRTLIYYGNSHYKPMMYYKPTPPVQSWCKEDRPWAYNTYYTVDTIRTDALVVAVAQRCVSMGQLLSSILIILLNSILIILLSSILFILLSSILIILLTCPNSDALLCYSNDPFLTVYLRTLCLHTGAPEAFWHDWTERQIQVHWALQVPQNVRSVLLCSQGKPARDDRP